MTHVVVDGSNVATEGRSLPSLAQLDEAVQAFLADYPADKLTVVVDATFGHRIDKSEHQAYEDAILAGELVCPPAGAIGRGDAFVLQIADKAGAVIFSNDSFQEFHGDYPWLFEEGRLIGGKPVPEVGWVFVARAPVRGPTSRRATKAVRSSRSSRPARSQASARASGPMPTPKKAPPRPPIAAVPEGAPEANGNGSRRSSRRRGGARVEPVNDPMPFIEFVGANPVGSAVEGVVERFSSHGAYVTIGDLHGYVPLKLLGDPPPRSAKELLTVGETRQFVVASFDPPRRSIDLTLAELPAVAVDSTVHETHAADAVESASAEAPSPAGKATAKRSTAAKKTTAAKKATAAKKSTAAKKATAARKSAAAKKTTAAKKSTAAKKAPAAKRTAAAKKTTAPAAKKTTAPAAKKASGAKGTAAKKAPTAKKTPAKKAPVAKKTAPKKAAATKRTPAKRTAAKKTGSG